MSTLPERLAARTDCPTCKDRKLHGGDGIHNHCNRCHGDWSGREAQHCVRCHWTFPGIIVADRHPCGRDLATVAGWREIRPGVWTDATPMTAEERQRARKGPV
jgi:hypothetical protein